VTSSLLIVTNRYFTTKQPFGYYIQVTVKTTEEVSSHSTKYSFRKLSSVWISYPPAYQQLLFHLHLSLQPTACPPVAPQYLVCTECTCHLKYSPSYIQWLLWLLRLGGGSLERRIEIQPKILATWLLDGDLIFLELQQKRR